jgi:hypothetical protein
VSALTDLSINKIGDSTGESSGLHAEVEPLVS